MRMILAPKKRGPSDVVPIPSIHDLKNSIPEIEILLDNIKYVIEIPENKIENLISLAAEFYDYKIKNE